jgi:hypothetical protein
MARALLGWPRNAEYSVLATFAGGRRYVEGLEQKVEKMDKLLRRVSIWVSRTTKLFIPKQNYSYAQTNPPTML